MNEKTLYETTPSAKVVVVWIFSRFTVGIGFILGFILFFMMGSFRINPLTIFSIGISVLPILLVILFVYYLFLYKTYRYKITERGIYLSGGILLKVSKFVPFFKITNVEATSNLIEQLLGVSKLSIHTAGQALSSQGFPFAEMTFEGIVDIETPKRLIYQCIKKDTLTRTRDE